MPKSMKSELISSILIGKFGQNSADEMQDHPIINREAEDAGEIANHLIAQGWVNPKYVDFTSEEPCGAADAAEEDQATDDNICVYSPVGNDGDGKGYMSECNHKIDDRPSDDDICGSCNRTIMYIPF